MIVLREFLPQSDLALLDENAQHNNLPRIGSDCNTAFPGGQINLVAAVKHAESQGWFIVHSNTCMLIAGLLSFQSRD